MIALTPPPALRPSTRDESDPAPLSPTLPPPRAGRSPQGGLPPLLPAGVKDWLLLGVACALFACLPLLVLATAYATARFGPAGYLLLGGIPPLVFGWEALGRSALDEKEDPAPRA